ALPNVGAQEVELSRVVPGQAGTVVAMEDVALPTGRPVDQLVDHGRVRPIEVTVLNPHGERAPRTEVGARERVAGERGPGALYEPVRMLFDPPGIEGRMVGHHVGRQPDPVPLGRGPQRSERRLAA